MMTEEVVVKIKVDFKQAIKAMNDCSEAFAQLSKQTAEASNNLAEVAKKLEEKNDGQSY